MSTQGELLKKFSKLHCDLLNNDIKTLQDFQVNYKHVTILALAPESEKEVINKMHVEAAKGFELQYARESGFGTSELSLHQKTKLHKLQPQELKSMPTNNICERLLATFSHHADVAKFIYRNFSTKGKKHNIVIHHENMLKNYSVWGDPCTTPNELELCIQNKLDIAEKIWKTKLSHMFIHTKHKEI